MMSKWKTPWKDPKVYYSFWVVFPDITWKSVKPFGVFIGLFSCDIVGNPQHKYQTKSLVHFEKYQIWSFYSLLLKLGSLESMWYNLRWRQNTTFKALYISHTVKHFYGTEFEILIGFGLVGSTENCQIEPIISYFWGPWFFDAVVLRSCCLWFREEEAKEVIYHLLRSLRDWKSFQSCFCRVHTKKLRYIKVRKLSMFSSKIK